MADRALDVRVAREVFGHQVREMDAWFKSHSIDFVIDAPNGEPHSKTIDKVPAYSSEISAAWLVVEHFRALDYWVRVQEMPDNRPFYGDAENLAGSEIRKRAICLIEGFNLPLSERLDGRGYGDTAAEAICRAALDVIRAADGQDGRRGEG